MKKSVWTVTPFLYVMAGLMAVMAAASWFWDPVIFGIEAGAVILMIGTLLFTAIRFRYHARSAMTGASRILTGSRLQKLDHFVLPLVVAGDHDDIVWVNGAFEKIAGDTSYLGRSLAALLGKIPLEDVIDSSAEITIGARSFTACGCKTDGGTLLYLIESTEHKALEKEFAETRPVVAWIAFDNREELSRDTNGGEDTRILGQVESTLNDWAYSVGGIYKKISGGTRYLVITDEKNFAREQEKQFAILDQIRKIKTSNGRSATISMGIGRGASNYTEGEQWAKASLDMALGRGGDQVAIKQESDSYEFYGGLSKGMEKRDKSRTRVIAAAISDQMRDSDMVMVMGHRYSDLDSVGSAVGMWSAAHRGMDKPAYIVIDKSQSLAGSLIETVEANIGDENQPLFITPEQALERMTPQTLLIVTDTHSQDYVESTEVLGKASRIVVVDHHRLVVRHIKNAVIFFHEPYASSASEMVAELVQFIGRNALSRTEAVALLAGIMLDTKGFVIRCGVRTFEAAAYLRRRGADTVDAKRLFSGSIENYKAKFQLVSNAEIYGNCAISSTTDTKIPNLRIVASQAADELLSIQSVIASFVLFESNGTISVSARSLGDVNVQILMEALGGGGHLTMAGAQIPGTNMETAKQTLLQVLETTLPKATKFQS
ncbi:MAG: DHH family phosphoesterase [Oscillospiraceae bacterium]|nr:DHH family phosphoesterase [Oscillospiraceae bacterium]